MSSIPPNPNFPSNLLLHPSLSTSLNSNPTSTSSEDGWKEKERIEMFGIAGRVWEASHPLLSYFTRPSDTDLCFSATRSLFSDKPKTILELGSGQSFSSLHLQSQLKESDRLVLTDLPEVAECVLKDNVDWWTKQSEGGSEVHVRSCTWGDFAAGSKILEETRNSGRELTHVLLIDLVYFPWLYPSLIRTLLQLTNHSSSPKSAAGGPEVILSYKTRSLAFEEPFFQSFEKYFTLVLLQSRSKDKKNDKDGKEVDWVPHGQQEETITFICKRISWTCFEEEVRSGELEGSLAVRTPELQTLTDEQIMSGSWLSRMKKPVGEQGGESSFGWEEMLLGGIEWG